jgi:hypothetical protein
MALLTRSRRYLTDAGRAFERAPVEITIAVVLAVAFSWAVEESGEAMRTWFEVVVPAGLMLAAAATGTILHAAGAWSAQRRWAATLGGAAVAAVYGIFVIDLEYAGEAWRALMLVVAALLWLVYVPALATDPDAATRTRAVDRVRAFNGRLLLRTFGALLYAAALFAGLALALGAIDTLFELDLRSEIYAHVFGWIFLVLAPWIVIGGLPDYVASLRAADEAAAANVPVPARPGSGDVARVAHRMSAFLVPPLLAIYFAILYAYVVRIGVTGEVPKNLLSPMVIAAGVLATLALFLFEPRSRDGGRAGTAELSGAADDGVDSGGGGMLHWLRIAPPLFLPLALLGMWAIGLRVGQYGWTEFRLLRIVVLITLTAIAAGATFQLMRRRRFSLHLAPLALGIVLLAGAVGPWSVTAVSRRSQQAELDTALRLADVDPESTVPLTITALPAQAMVRMPAAPRPARADTVTGREVPGDVYDRINDAARYLAQHFGPDALPPVLRAAIDAGASPWNLASTIGLRRPPPEPHDGAVVRMRDMTVYRLIAAPQRTGTAVTATSSGAVTIRQDSATLQIQVGGEHLVADLSRYINAARAAPDRGAALTADDARLVLTNAAGAVRGELLILHINLNTEDGALRLQNLDALLFVADGGG